MQSCYPHVHNDPNSKCAGCVASSSQITCGAGGHVALRLSVERASASDRAADARRVASAFGAPRWNDPFGGAGSGGPRRTRPPMIVVYASALLEALLRTPAASAVERWLFRPRQTLHAPHLIDVEVAQVVRRYAVNGEIDGERGRAVLADLADLPLRRYPH